MMAGDEGGSRRLRRRNRRYQAPAGICEGRLAGQSASDSDSIIVILLQLNLCQAILTPVHVQVDLEHSSPLAVHTSAPAPLQRQVIGGAVLQRFSKQLVHPLFQMPQQHPVIAGGARPPHDEPPADCPPNDSRERSFREVGNQRPFWMGMLFMFAMMPCFHEEQRLSTFATPAMLCPCSVS